MKIDYFGTKEGTIPVLVDMFDSQDLVSLAQNNTPEAREQLVNHIVAFLDVPLSTREKELAADVLIDLMKQAERDLRKAISERLATMDDVPFRVLLSIAKDEIDVAAPLLERNKCLGELDLLYVIENTGADHWRTIATRSDVADDIILKLAQTEDFETAMNLAQNESLSLSEAVVSKLMDIAREEQELAVPLARRNEVPTKMVKAIYNSVGDAIKKQLDGVLSEQETAKIDQTVTEVAGGVSQGGEDFELPSASHVGEAKAAKAKGLLHSKLLLSTLKRKQTALFIAQFCVLMNLPLKRALKVLEEGSGQKLAIACKATGFDRTDFIAMYTLSAYLRGQSSVQTEDIQKATEYYTMIGVGAAKQLLKSL